MADRDPLVSMYPASSNDFAMDCDEQNVHPQAGPSSSSTFALRQNGASFRSPDKASKTRKRPAKLALIPSNSPVKRTSPEAGGSRSVPASPHSARIGSSGTYGSGDARAGESAMGGGIADTRDLSRKLSGFDHEGRTDLRDTLRGAPRRRPSVLFVSPPVTQSGRPSGGAPQLPALNISAARKASASEASWPSSGPPAVWQDPSEHILSGNGSSLQHARSSYASGPIEVLPGLFLGDEFNACDEHTLAQRGITTILNVAKETTLPCQDDKSSRDLGFLHQSATLTRGLEKHLTLQDEAATPTSARYHGQQNAHFVHPSGNFGPPSARDDVDFSMPPKTAATDVFFTPLTSTFAHPLSAMSTHSGSPKKLPTGLPPSISQSYSRPSSLYLRNSSSTPNLLQQYDFATPPIPGAYRTHYDGSDDEDMLDEAEGEDEGASDSLASHAASSQTTADTAPPSPSDDNDVGEVAKLSPSDDVTATTPSSSTFSRRSPATATGYSSASSSSSGGSYVIALPSNAVALSVPPSPQSGRTWPIRYVKLPWTHDETDLANAASTGGFVTGCAIIADALGIDLRNGQMSQPLSTSSANAEDNSLSPKQNGGRGGILVHCQCGVSRSATLIIAFVMQAAAYEYDFAQTNPLTGMHDCYEMVKAVSSSISPNISLIYQLVEWERYLSSQVASRQRDQVQDALTAAALRHNQIGVPLVSTPSVKARIGSGAIEDAHSTEYTAVPIIATAKPTLGERRWGKEVIDEEDWMRMRAEEERKEQEQEEAQKEERMRQVREREVQWRAAQASRVNGNEIFSSLSEATDSQQSKFPTLASTAAGSIGARRKKPSPSLTLLSSSKTNADRALKMSSSIASATPAAAPNGDLTSATNAPTALPTMAAPVLNVPPPIQELDGEISGKVGVASEAPDDPAQPSSASASSPALDPAHLHAAGGMAQSNANVFKWRQRPLSSSSSIGGSADPSNLSRPNSRPGSGYGNAAFGALGQSAAERRIKHKRTFSAEVPDWNARNALLMRSKTDQGSSRLHAAAVVPSLMSLAQQGAAADNDAGNAARAAAVARSADEVPATATGIVSFQQHQQLS